MVHTINKLTQITQNNPLVNRIEKDLDLKQNSLSVSKTIEEDKVDISQKLNVDYLRVQAGVLKNELPGMIANSLLAPLSEGMVSNDPLNSILSRLVNPAKSLLASTAADNFSKDQLSQFQREIRQLSNEVPKMISNSLLSPLNRNAAKSSALNGILNSIASELISLADLMKQGL